MRSQIPVATQHVEGGLLQPADFGRVAVLIGDFPQPPTPSLFAA